MRLSLLRERMWRAARRPRDLRIASYTIASFGAPPPSGETRHRPDANAPRHGARMPFPLVMPGLVPGIQQGGAAASEPGLCGESRLDGRDKPGHDKGEEAAAEKSADDKEIKCGAAIRGL